MRSGHPISPRARLARLRKPGTGTGPERLVSQLAIFVAVHDRRAGGRSEPMAALSDEVATVARLVHGVAFAPGELQLLRVADRCQAVHFHPFFKIDSSDSAFDSSWLS